MMYHNEFSYNTLGGTMKRMLYKRITALLFAFILVFCLSACGDQANLVPAEESVAASNSSNITESQENDIVILYTNDVHCGYSQGLGYAALAAMKADLLEVTPYVTLVDGGDSIQGEVIGTISNGEYLVDMMNRVGYDLAILGNHEFDFGMEQLSSIIDRAEYSYISCNITYTGSGTSALSNVSPYKILEYGDTSVAFIGVTTPETLTSSTPTYFMEDDEFVYGFTAGNDGADLFACVQCYVDECRDMGADYVVLVAHLGEDTEVSAYNTPDLIANTTGIDVVLDAHAHSVIPCRILSAQDGNDVLLTSTGTKLANIGKLVISENGQLTTTLISAYPRSDADVESYISSIEGEFTHILEDVVATSDTALYFHDEAGIRLVRSRETTIGNFCADAYRFVTGADIAIVNGGGVRADLEAGDITYGDLISVHPFGNTICMIEATGQEILDTLEITSRAVQAEYCADGLAVGEEGSFLQVSGIRYTVDTTIPSSVTFDENGMFLSIDGQRRVTSAEVLGDDGEYSPIDPEAVYTLASHNYIIKDGGGGNTLFMDNTLLIDGGLADYQVLHAYITEVLGGELGSLYSEVEGRITIR